MKILLFGLVLVASAANAQSQLVVWDVVGLENNYVTAVPAAVNSIELDITAGSFFQASGAIRVEGNVLIPAHGSCFNHSTGVWCELTVRHMTYVMNLSQSISGELIVLNQDGSSIATAAVTYR